MMKANNEILNVGFDEEVTIKKLARKILKEFGDSTKVIETKPAWANDTKWRKPSLTRLNKYIDGYKHLKLKKGLKTLRDE